MTLQQTAVYIASLLLASTNVISPAVLDKITSTHPGLNTQILVNQKSDTQKLTNQMLASQNVATAKSATQELTVQKLASKKIAAQKLAAQKLATQKLETQKLAAQKLAAQKMITHLFQSKSEPRVIRTTIYDGPFKHGSPMLTHQEDTAAIHDCFASFHLPNESAGFSNAI